MIIERELFGRVKRGDDITFDTVDFTVDGNAQDLTDVGWSVLAQLRPLEDSTTVVDMAIDEAGLAVSTIICSLTSAQTTLMTPGIWVGDIQVTSPDWITSSETFEVEIVADVSRDV